MCAASVLAHLPSEASTQALIAALSDGAFEVRECAARSLGAHGDALAVMPLIDCLADPHPHVRHAAIQSLSALNDPRALTALAQVQHHDDGGTAWGAVLREVAAAAYTWIATHQVAT